ncbi:MAG: 6,7-dimethyl-8-ribityllumazine synthase [Candidatus Muiribacterium halophilum]|uniref:6,7-dimethyl-8-ribityllumazine synthase n=1 Tax=Muiribacterium halophilum TaxID=2053465 RepID=A0A2N5ZFE5_MUIH1|nr:MAG: 6,7-dimethyl-8-ribityllumazine synthase [Candidatus Muirbacterium halophilum]
MKVFEGNFNGKGCKIAIAASRFNSTIVEQLIKGCEDGLLRNGVKDSDISLFKVPGAFELPQLANRLAASKKYDGVVVLGAVIRGETPHFDYVAAEVSKGVASVSFESKTPVIFGVLTTDNTEQALHRSGIKSGNKGFEAALSCLETIDLYKNL